MESSGEPARHGSATPDVGVGVVAELPSGIRIGDVVADKYRILRVLGSGAIGIVVEAHHLNLDRSVAIKFLTDEALHHPDAKARFVREARAPARMTSPHVVRVHDADALVSGVPYIVLEYLDGCDLAARLQQTGRIPIGQAVDFVLQACDAIAEAHDLGIVHRDLKPANLFLVSGAGGVESVKVVDFGISKSAGALAATVSPAEARLAALSTGPAPIGSPCYMSPEQMQSARDVDARTDIWALGVTLCELVTGQLPFQGASLVELYATIRSRAPLLLRSRFPELPVELEAVLLRCFEFDREHRFSSTGALASALLPFAPNPWASYVQRVARRYGARSPTGHHVPSSSGGADAAAGQVLTQTRVSGTPTPIVVVSPLPHRRARPALLWSCVVLVAAAVGVGTAVAMSAAWRPAAGRESSRVDDRATAHFTPTVASTPLAFEPNVPRAPPDLAAGDGTTAPPRRDPISSGSATPAAPQLLRRPAAPPGTSGAPPTTHEAGSASDASKGDKGGDRNPQPNAIGGSDTRPGPTPIARPAPATDSSEPTEPNIVEILRRRK
jgi:eukaryotic-like serine/threonine-protein kinase